MNTTTTTVVAMPFEQRVPQFVHQHRDILGPPALAVLVFTTAAGFHATRVWPWMDLRWVGVLVAVVFTGIGLQAASGLPSELERRIAIPGWLAGCAWLAVASWFGPWNWFLTSVLIAGTVVLGVPWAWHHRVRRGVEVDREIPAWGDGSAVGLPGTRARGTKAGADWYSYLVKADVAGRYTLSAYRNMKARIAALHGVRAEAVTIRETKSEGEVEVTIRQGEKRKVAFSRIEEPKSIIGPHEIATFDDGERLSTALYLEGHGGAHEGIIGVTGSGKSSLINRYGAITVAAPNALLLMVDLSPGAKELRAWVPACLWFATTVDEAERMFDWLLFVCEDRGARNNGRLFVPSEAEPALVVAVDEAATLYAPHLLPAGAEYQERLDAQRVAAVRAKKAETLFRLARKYGISVRMATQYGNEAAFGGEAAKGQLIGGYGTVFRCADDRHGYMVIPAHHGVKASEIPRSAPGTCCSIGLTSERAALARVDYMTDEDIAATVQAWAPRQGTPEPSLTHHETYQRRQRNAPTQAGAKPERTPQDAEPASPPPTAPRRMGSEQESLAYVATALARYPEGVQLAELTMSTGKSRDLLERRLEQLAELGQARKVARGRWAPMPNNHPKMPNNDAEQD